MAATVKQSAGWRGSRWRKAAWAAALLVLLAPAVAMQFTADVVWTPFDFAVAGTLLFGSLLAFELSVRMSASAVHRAAYGLAIGAALLLVWANLAVGIIGSENDPVNLLHFGALGAGIVVALIARFRPAGMALATLSTALVLAAIAVFALITGAGAPYSGPGEIIAAHGIFAAVFAVSAWLFRRGAAAGPAPASA